MAYRLIIIILPHYENLEDVKSLLEKYDVLSSWHIESTENNL